ncbi:sensor histidine kinase [Enterococcus sp. CSURQ0835]|uniref:sensor histidine kinase n=1 Tax=Enterococcus sp. CSURQ0835 TaxID=2681394 RepID=UPI001359D48A|nr:HAMP domain-containing sensor histidine kinase [Enterococcus sp. CSURQ0835]
MENDLAKKQGIRFFGMNLIAFALIFLSLGFIMFQIIDRSAYQETDRMLLTTSQDQRIIQRELNRLLGEKQVAPPPDRAINHFNTQIILWSADGKMLNPTEDVRLAELSQLKLNRKKLNQIKPLTLNSKTDTELTFHSLTTKLPATLDSPATDQVAYIQFLANTNQVTQTMKTFKLGLVICMAFFWLLSLAVSYYLSRLTLRPLLTAWRKQQEFVENASHELRTPLTIIQNQLQRLFTKPNATILDESEAIAQALNETRRLTTLTSDLLTIARSDSNQLLLEKTPVDITQFLTETLQPFQELAAAEEKKFTLNNQASGKITVDEKRIHQLLVILLDNALKYTKAGDSITVTSQKMNRDWVIAVQNTGPSIEPKAQKQLFERFYREDPSRNKQTGGYGLGLAIAAQIVAEHQGKIKVSDNLPQGVVFTVKLPVS